MSTHNICFCGKIRKIPTYFGCQKKKSTLSGDMVNISFLSLKLFCHSFYIFIIWLTITVITLNHLCLASHKRDTGKQCRPRSDVPECSILSKSTHILL